MISFSSLKRRLQFIVLAAVAPALLLALYSDLRHRRSAESGIRNEVLVLSRLATGSLTRHIDVTRHLLLALSSTSAMGDEDRGAGSDFLRKIHAKYPDYTNLGMTDAQGNVVCSSAPMKGSVNVSDKFWFRQAVRTRDFSIGEYQIGRITGVPVLVLGQPVTSGGGRVKSVFFASLSLDRIKRMVAEVKLPAGFAFVIADRSGTVLTRYPDPERWAGKPAPEPFRRALLLRDRNLAEIAGVDGEKRIYAFSTAEYKDNPLHLAIGVSKRIAFGQLDKTLAIDLVLLLLVAGVCLLAAELFCNAAILRPVAALKSTAQRLAAGDLDARVNLSSGTDEILLLAGTFDRMAEKIQGNVAMFKAAEDAIRIANEELVAVNRVITAITGVARIKDVFKKVLDEVLEITGLEGGTICMVTPGNTLQLAAHRATSEATILDLTTNEIKVGDCLCGECARDHKPLILSDREAVLEFATREATRGEDIRFHAAFPLITGGKCLGVLCVFTRTDKKPAERKLKMLETVAPQIALAVENARLYEETMQSAVTLENKIAARTAELQEANVRLKEVDRLKSTFLSAMSHELRTPLNSILGFTGILLQELAGPLNEEQRKQLGMVKNSARHLLALINDVLDISRIEAGQMEIARDPFDLPGTIESVREAMEPLAAAKGLALSTVVDPGIGPVTSDRRRVEQILINLVGNAVKFTESGEVRIECRVREGRVEIRVADTGIGIRAEEMGKLFVPFQQIESGVDRPHEGTGLGLSISRKLVELLGGEIRAESAWGAGSAFSFTLPMEGRSGEEDPGHRG